MSHTARSTEMLALSLAHDSVNSLLGPLAQRGVQGCMEINQQLALLTHHPSLPTTLTGSECMTDMNNPKQTLFNSRALSRKCRS